MLSFWKILLIVGVIVAVIYGPRMFKKLKSGIATLGDDDSASTGDTTDLTKCPDCGAYVAQLSDHTCDKS
jgi:hypothetical protein